MHAAGGRICAVDMTGKTMTMTIDKGLRATGWSSLIRLLSALSLQLPDLSLGFCLMLLLVGGRIKVFPGIYHFDCELEIRMSRKGLQH